jgi:hypothetical protein
MPRHDNYGDRGSKRDRRDIAIVPRSRIGSLHRLHRSDGTRVDFRETVAGKRVVPGSDTRES